MLIGMMLRRLSTAMYVGTMPHRASAAAAGRRFWVPGYHARDRHPFLITFHRQRASLQPTGGIRRLAAAAQLSRPLAAAAAQTDAPASHAQIVVDVDVTLDGILTKHSWQDTDQLLSALEADSRAVVQAAVTVTSGSLEPHELSVVLCDDRHIRLLNAEWRQKDAATDVLSFPMGDDAPSVYPVRMLGDVVISLDTAERQATDAGHSLQQECRVLLVHGVLHLLGLDHEDSEHAAAEMAATEAAVMAHLGWQGAGLIESAANGGGTSAPLAEQGAAPVAVAEEAQRRRRPPSTSDIRLLACDMDGTLLDSRSQVLPSTVAALRAALDHGITVMLATGKARPAAIACMQGVGLAGDGLVVSTSGPGVFLQGLAVHALDGRPLASPDLPPAVVNAAFRYAQQHNVPLSAFLGDVCVTLQMHSELEELHHRYFEPLSSVAPTLAAIEAGPPVKKLLFMTDPAFIAGQLKPHWEAELVGSGAQTMMAVDNMLEVVPAGMHKWVGMDVLLRAMNLDASQVMTIGDGSNDLQLVGTAGIGVAMGNAVNQVKDVATYVTASNNDDGVAQAVERFLL